MMLIGCQTARIKTKNQQINTHIITVDKCVCPPSLFSIQVKYSIPAECEIISFGNCEISPFGRCEMKFASSHLQSKYFTA
jgi:hypothetical protein